jgi:spermidine/putrescine transport system ATP-binding protein
MTVFDNVAFGLRRRGLLEADVADRVGKALDLVRLEGMAGRMPAQLSGGQQQRTALARSLVLEPPVLLLDEPLAALDRKLREQMRVELKRIQHEVGITSIYVTHDQEEALSMADRIAVMEDGILLQLGAPREVYNSPSTNFVASFLGETTKLAGAVERLDRKFAHIATKGGFHVTVANNGTMQQGDEMVVSVRPERVRLSRSKPAQEENVLAGTVDFVSYLGAHVTYIVRIEGGDVLLKADEQLTSGRAAFEEGDKVFACWDAASTVCLRC